ncbi:MAG: NosD domain-containing protein, partial [Myxococcota bacterium]|nr:NosD domain-containing protein [Myxococcota bacterium]
ESNAIVAEFADDVFARLFVAPTIVMLYVDGLRASSTTVTLTGLPTDDSHVLFTNGYAERREVTPADGGSVTLPLDLSAPRLLWLQSRGATLVIGGPDDACETVGVRDGSTCTLTTDVADNVLIAESGQTLDCNGHAIMPPLAGMELGTSETTVGEGAGITVWEVAETAIRRCNIGSVEGMPMTGGFGVGIQTHLATGVEISDCALTGNISGILVSASSGAVIRNNRLSGKLYSGISIQDAPFKSIEEMPPALPNEVSGNTFEMPPPVPDFRKAAAIELRSGLGQIKPSDGMSPAPPLPPTTVRANVVEGGANAILLDGVTDAEVVENDLEGVLRGLVILPGGWPNRVWHNNITATEFGVMDARRW